MLERKINPNGIHLILRITAVTVIVCVLFGIIINQVSKSQQICS